MAIPGRLKTAGILSLAVFVVIMLLITSYGSTGVQAAGNTPTPTPAAPPFPNLKKITLDNAGNMKPVAYLGYGSLTTLAWSPDSKTVAIASEGGIYILPSNTLAVPRQQLDTKSDNLSCLAFKPDGTILAGIYADPKDKTALLRYWDVSSGQSVPIPDKSDDWATCALRSPDGKLSAQISEHESIVMLDAATGKTLVTIKTNAGTVWDLAFSPDSRLLASAQDDNSVRLWDVSTGHPVAVLQGHIGAVVGVTFSPDGGSLASIGANGTLRIWNMRTLRIVATWKFTTLDDLAAGNNKAQFSPDGKRLMLSNHGEIQIWDVLTARIAARMDTHIRFTRSVALSSDGLLGASAEEYGRIIVWDMTNLQAIDMIPDSAVNCGGCDLQLSPDGTLLAVPSIGGVLIWDVKAHQVKTTLSVREDGPFAFAFSPDGSVVAASYRDGSVRLWDTQTFKLKTVLKEKAPDTNCCFQIVGMAFSQDGALLVTGNQQASINIWDIKSGTVKSAISVGKSIDALAISPDGATVAASADGQIVLWDVIANKKKATMTSFSQWVRAIVFSADGTFLITGGDLNIEIWDLQTQKRKTMLTVTPHDALWDAGVRSMALSADGRLLLLTVGDHMPQLWGVEP